MNKGIVDFLFGESQVREALEALPDDVAAMFLEAEKHSELTVQKAPLAAALKQIGVTTDGLEVGVDDILFKTDDPEAYRVCMSKLVTPEAMTALAELGWVAVGAGDTAMAAEVPEYRVRFIMLGDAGAGDGTDGSPDKQTVDDIIKAAVDFATSSDLPKADDDPGFKPSKGAAPGVGKPTAGGYPAEHLQVPDAELEKLVAQTVIERRHRLTPDVKSRKSNQRGKIRREQNRPQK